MACFLVPAAEAVATSIAKIEADKKETAKKTEHDLERHEDGDDRYLRFETQDGKRYTISYGIQDTVIIIEKDQPKNANE